MPAGQVSESLKERFHRRLLMGVQRLRGRRVAAFIRQLQDWERLDPAAFQRLRAQRLANTLEYARNTIPMYRTDRWREAFRLGDAGDLRSWPVLDRQNIRAGGVDLLIQPNPPPHYFRRTSGSTGDPLGVAMDAEAASWAWATDYRGLLWHGITIGARCLRLTHQREGLLADWIRNSKHLSTTDLSSPRLAAGVRYLERSRPTYVAGYVSAVAALARYARVNAPDAPRPLVPFAKVLGEMLYPFQRQEIEEALGARVIETYGCNETGTVAYECPAGSLHVFAEHVEVEILRDGVPVEPGETGDIVLTCTTNRVMPLIRYRVGDRGRFSPEPCSCGRPHPVIAGVEGRIGDLLLTAAGVPVHGSALAAVLKQLIATWSPAAVEKVLFEQHDKRTWTVQVQPGSAFHDGIAAYLVDRVHSIFGKECRVRVELVREIASEPSGKFRFYRLASARKPEMAASLTSGTDWAGRPE